MQVEFTIVLNDVIVYFIALLYAILVLTVGDLGRRRLKLGSDFTRKIIHLFAGGAIWTVPFYPHPWVAVLVALTFVVMVGLSTQERFGRFFSAMARPEDLEHGSVRGPFWYAVSITILTAIFTFTGYVQYYFIGAAAIHIMMLGDGMSAPIGMRYGKNHTVTIFGSKRSLEGSLALFFFGLLGATIAVLFFGAYAPAGYVLAPVGQILWSDVFILALSGAGAATLIELVSPKGTDNITLPFGTTMGMYLVAVYLGLVVL